MQSFLLSRASVLTCIIFAGVGVGVGRSSELILGSIWQIGKHGIRKTFTATKYNRNYHISPKTMPSIPHLPKKRKCCRRNYGAKGSAKWTPKGRGKPSLIVFVNFRGTKDTPAMADLKQKGPEYGLRSQYKPAAAAAQH